MPVRLGMQEAGSQDGRFTWQADISWHASSPGGNLGQRLQHSQVTPHWKSVSATACSRKAPVWPSEPSSAPRMRSSTRSAAGSCNPCT